jgi:hypothetical protein
MDAWILLLAALKAFGAQASLPAITGDELARRIDERDRGDDGRLEMEMRVHDHRGREIVRRLTVLLGREGPLDRLLLRFVYPGDIRDTGLLSIERSDGEDDRFLYLPALGRSRRIAAQEEEDSFVGSDFSYEDISGQRLEDYDYEVLGVDIHGGRPVYLLESSRKDPGSRRPRSVSWVDGERFVILKSEIFDASGDKSKEFNALRVERVDGIWTIMEQNMRSLRSETQTTLVVTRAAYNRGLASSLFSRQTLERGGELP